MNGVAYEESFPVFRPTKCFFESGFRLRSLGFVMVIEEYKQDNEDNSQHRKWINDLWLQWTTYEYRVHSRIIAVPSSGVLEIGSDSRCRGLT